MNNDSLINYELELLILSSLSKYGVSVIPDNYSFLKKYALLTLYFNYIDCNMKKIPSLQFSAAISKRAADYIPQGMGYPELIAFYRVKGSEGLKELLSGYYSLSESDLKLSNIEEHLISYIK